LSLAASKVSQQPKSIVQEEAEQTLTEKEAYAFAIQQVDLAVADIASQEAIQMLLLQQRSQAIVRGMLKLRELAGLDNSIYAPKPQPSADE
jgi:hypothetical protein